MPVPRTTRLWLIAIATLGAVLRIGWAWYAARSPSVTLHDPNSYLFLSDGIARGNGYVIPLGQGPTAYYPVGYPAVLGAVNFVLIHTIGDHPIGAAAALNVVAGVASIVLVFAIGRRLSGDRLGLVAAGIVALYPNLVYHSAVVLTETVFVFVLLVLTWTVVSGPWNVRAFGTKRLVAIGVMLGVCVLIRPVAAPIVGALFVTWVIAGFGWRRALAHSAIAVGVVVLVVTPWLVRNLRTMDSLTLSTNTGDNFCMSRHDGANGTFQFGDNPCFTGFEDLPRPAFETERDNRNRRLAVEFARDHPIDETKLWVKRLYHTFKSDWDGLWAAESYGDDPWMSPRLRDALRTAGSGYFFGTLVLASIGVPLLLRRRDPCWLLMPLMIVATVVVPVVATFGDTRFHVPAVPFIALMAALPIVTFADRAGPRATRV